ncbi:putative quinol monooxygenase [Streptococcus dentiloxodontae]
MMTEPIFRIFALSLKEEALVDFAEVGRYNLTTSIKNESDTFAMYSTHLPHQSQQSYVVEVYANQAAYERHAASEQFAAFVKVASQGLLSRTVHDLEAQLLLEKDEALFAPTGGNFAVRLAKIEVKEQDNKAFAALVLDEMKQSMAKEKGVLVMYAGRERENPNIWYFFEIYADETAYQTHRETPHFKNYLSQTAHMAAHKELLSLTADTLVNQGGLHYKM